MTDLRHRIDGSSSALPLLLGPSLGTSLDVWAPQVSALSSRHRVVRWDLPGHGESPPAVLTTVADLAQPVLALADALGLERFAYAGISIGGAIGAWIAAHHPERITSLALICTSARFDNPDAWRERADRVRAEGTGWVAETVASRWFTPGFEQEALVEDLKRADPESYAACCDALAGYDLRDSLGLIKAPTLVIAGRSDPVAGPAHARVLADGIPTAGLTEIAGASHLANVEQPAAVQAALLNHFSATSGMAVRRAVLGDEYVDRAIARTDSFTAAFQDFITRYAWGETWTRPGLTRQTRSAVTLTALVAGGHHDELAMHVRAALRNGLTPDEISEVLLQTAVYLGVPAANAAYAVAGKVLREEGF